MSAKPNPTPGAAEPSLRDRASALRAATTKGAHPTRLENLLSDARSFADQIDLASFSVTDLGRLYEVTCQADDYWGHVGNMPLCTTQEGSAFPQTTPIGWFVQSEEQRMAFLRDRCVAEIAQRTPACQRERNEILRVRITHELECNGRIDRVDAPDLLIEALKAWG